MVGNQADHTTNLKENVMHVTCAPASPINNPALLEGTLVIETIVVNPVRGSKKKDEMKRVTLATHRCVTFAEAEVLVDKFKEFNSVSIKAGFINATWTARKYL
jgi:hypothetical protein